VTKPLRATTVLIDVDGTLVDSNGAHAEAWTQAFREHSVSADANHIRRLIGMGGDKLLPKVAHVGQDSNLGQAIIGRKQSIFDALLPELALLHRAGLADLIPERTSKDDASASKPDPDIVLAALAKAHARAEQSVLVGDTPYDIDAAGRAGVRAIALRCGGYWDDQSLRGADDIFDDPAALLSCWRQPSSPLVSSR
jgi:beta-phosphoglucomutase-like phosphatase (HAD superfamily)